MWILRVTMLAVAAWGAAATEAPEYYVYNEYANNDVCTGTVQRQMGYRFGACIMNGATNSILYSLISWTETTKTLKYSETFYTTKDCSGAGQVQTYTQDGSRCSSYADGSSVRWTYAKGRTPWDQVVVGGVVDAYYYQQDPATACQGPIDKYYAEGYDYCSKGTFTSWGPTACWNNGYVQNTFSDDHCGTVSYSNAIDRTICSYNEDSSTWRSTYCALASENYLAAPSSDDDPDADVVVSTVALGISFVAIAASSVAILAWVCAMYDRKPSVKASMKA